MDEVWNGLCLCPNHHAAFDDHRLWIDPDNGTIHVHQDLRTAATAGDRAVVETLRLTIELPADRAAHPRPEMFRQRYAQPEVQAQLGWVTAPQ